MRSPEQMEQDAADARAEAAAIRAAAESPLPSEIEKKVDWLERVAVIFDEGAEAIRWLADWGAKQG